MSHMNSWSWNLTCIHNMNLHMNSWSWRILWNHVRIQLQICFREGKCCVLLIQSNHHPSFAVSSLQALRLLCGCCSVVTRLCYCFGKTAGAAHSRAGRMWRAMLAHHICYWRVDLLRLLVSKKGNFRNLQVQRLLKGSTSRTEFRLSNYIFRKLSADDSNTKHNTQIMTWRFTGKDLAEECFPSSCCLQHYADTGTSKMQVTSEEAKGAQSWKQNLLLREILSDGTEDLIESHNCPLFWIQNLKMPIFFCLNMLEICIQTILEAKLS